MAHMITNGYSLFKKRMVLCESLRVTTEKTGLGCFSRSPLVGLEEGLLIGDTNIICLLLGPKPSYLHNIAYSPRQELAYCTYGVGPILQR